MSGSIVAAPTYPWVICNAVTRVFDIDELRRLHDSATKLLVALVKKVDKNNGTSPIFAKRVTLARDIGRSVETVYRGLKILEEQGLIEEREQSQDATGRLAESVITLSSRVCELLQLPTRRGSRRGPVPSVTNARPNVYRLGSQFFKDQSNELSDKIPTTTGGQTIRIGKFWIPADLGVLLDRDVVATAVLALMKRAKVAGKRLSDVVQCVSQRVTALDLRAKQLYAYLLTAIDGTRDYGKDAASLREDAKQMKEREALAQHRVELEGVWFVPIADAKTRLKVEKGTVYVFEYDDTLWRHTTTVPLGKDFADAIEKGRLTTTDALSVESYRS